jgi:CHAT domain-containing protein/Tfp pilus assembly protein PilF
MPNPNRRAIWALLLILATTAVVVLAFLAGRNAGTRPPTGRPTAASTGAVATPPVLPPLLPGMSPMSPGPSVGEGIGPPVGEGAMPKLSVEQFEILRGGQGVGSPGEVFSTTVDAAQVLTQLQAAVATARANRDPAAEARVLLDLAGWYRGTGQFELALARYEEALPLLAQADDATGQITALSEIAFVYDLQNRYQDALACYEKALAAAQKAGARQHEATIRNNIALLYKNLGRYPQALEQYEQALAIWRAVGDRSNEGYTLNNLGGLYAALGRYDAALERYQAALALERQFGDGQRVGRILSNIGAVYADQGRYDEALKLFQEALAIARQIGDVAGEGIKETNIGAMLGEMQLYNEAMAQHQAALAIARKLGNREAEGVNLYNIGFWQETQGNLAGAIQSYQQAIAVFETIQGELRVEELAAAFAGRQPDRYGRLIRLLAQTTDTASAFDYAERGRSQAFLNQIGNRQADFRQGAAAELAVQERELRQRIAGLQNALARERARPFDQQNQGTIEALLADLEQARQEYAGLLTRLKLASPEYASLVSVNALTLAEVQAQVLDEHTTLIEYFVLDDQTLAWVIDRDHFTLVKLPIGRADLRNKIEFLRNLIAARDFDVATAAGLYDTLFAPLVPHIRYPNTSAGLPGPSASPSWPMDQGTDSASLVIVPHDVLHYLPFAALWNAQSGRYLIQDYALTYAPSASALKFIQAKRTPKRDSLPNGDEGRLLALGNPDGTLLAAEGEARAVAGLYGVAPLVGAQATESQVRARGGQVDILHLAAHGVYEPLDPLFSRIELAAGDGQDGRLEVHEVYGLDLTGVNLVVLSACNTALAAQSAGDELVGLTRAFLYAGTPAVVTTLWDIEDTASAALMEAFYRHLRAGLSTAEALRAAQLEVLGQDKWRTPYYWAAFSLTGDYRG